MQRAEEAHKAHKALDAKPGDAALVARFHAAVAAAYPPGFWDAYEGLRQGDPAGIDMAIAFLTADPWFFRSGYIKANLARFLKRMSLTRAQARSLEQVLLNMVDRRHTEEFRPYCRLARAMGTVPLVNGLKERLSNPDADVRRRAQWMLACMIDGKNAANVRNAT